MLSVYLQSQSIILHIDRPRQYRTLIVRRIERQTQHDLVLSSLEVSRIEDKLVRNIVTAYGRTNGTRAAVVIPTQSVSTAV
jgi:hypothetical protein